MEMTINSIEDLQSQPEYRAQQDPVLHAPEPHEQELGPQVRAALNIAQQKHIDANTVNNSIALGAELGLPPRAVLANMEYARRESIARKIDEDPYLSTWIDRDELRAALVAGDSEKFHDLSVALQNEYLHRKAQRNDLNGFQKFGLLLEEGIQDVANSMEAGVTGAVRALGQTQFTDDEGSRSAPFAEATASWADTMDRQRDAFVKAQPPRLEAQTTFGGYLQDIVRMVPQIGSQIAATLATGGAGGLAFMGNQIAGSTYDKLRRDGVDTNRAFLAGLGNAALQAPLEQIGLGRIMNVFKASGIKNIAKGSFQGAATEGFTEFLQAYPESATELWAKLGENEGAKQWFEQFTNALPETTRQGIYEGLVAAPFGIFGGIGRAVQENAMNRFVENFQQRQIDFHDKVDALREGGMDVSVIENACDHGGMGTELGISAQGLVELHQSGRDLITPLGLNYEDVVTAAEAGQDIVMSLSKMHAPLDKENFAALAPHIRPSMAGPTAMEAAANPVNMADVQRVAELYQDNHNLFAELDAEKARLKEELRAEMQNSPNLQAQVESFGDFDKFTDDWLSMVERYALRMGTSQDPVETMRRVTLDKIRAARRAEMSPEDIIQEDLTELAPQSVTETGNLIGSPTRILGKGDPENARYEVWEMDSIIPSHDPEHNFARRLDYPADAQERPYHSDPGEQEKVRGNALNYQPDFVLNTDPTAGNGPPIVTRNGIVLGGNSRTMTLQMVYANNEQGAQSYRDMLAANGQLFGIDPSSVANMRRPILVRVVDGDISLEDMAVKSRLYNQTTTQKLQQKAEGVSRARLISADTLNMLAERMAEFDTLRQFMDSPKSKDFVQSLQNDGVIEKTEYSSLTDSAGKLNDSGKKLVEDALRGFVVPNYDVLEATPPSILAKIDKAIPALAKLKARGEGWDLTNVLLPALRYLSQAALEEKKIDVWLGQADLLDMDADKKRPAVQALALTLGNATQKEVAARFDAFAAEATRQPKGVSMLMAMPENNPAPAFIRAFLRPIVSVDGNNIADFNPASNNTHKALQWAYDHGGKSHSVDVAMNALQKDMVSEKASEQEKIEAREMMGALAEYSGEIRIQEPKLGNFFHYKKGQELFQDGHDYPNNGKPVGEVTPEFAQVMKLHKTGKIVLDDKSIAHIEERHGKQIRGLGFEDAESFVRYVLDNVDVIYAVDDGRKYDLVSRQITPQGRVMIRLEFVDPEEYYSISTAGPVRKDNYKKKTPLWERAQSNHSNEGTPGAISGQSGIEINLSHINPNDNTLNSIDSTGSKRGSVQIYPESYLINLFEKADLSTLLHETGHVFFEEMERLVRAGAADASVIADYQTMRDWLGAKDGEQLTTEQREQAARGFEAYLMEGKAPTPELQSAFRRFKKWLLRIYQSAVGLRVELNDDVRAVFSRMISTEQEINRAASENELLELTAKEISALGLTDNEARQINKASAVARELAAEALNNARNANRLARRDRYAKEAAAELAENQTYIARRDLRKTPLDIDAITNNFGENLAKALRKKLPATTKKDGADPEIFAAQHGYKSADEMFTDILNSQTKGDAIREIVDRKEAESDANYSAMEALLDTQDISTQMDLVGRKLADLVGVQQIERQAYTVAAQQELARMPVGKATQTGRYMAAMRRNILSYRRALLAGDREKALDFNRKALLNYEFAKQSRDLSKSTKKFVDATKRFVGSKTADPDVRFLVMELASKFGVVRENEALARGREFGKLLPSWLADVQADGYDLFLDDALIRGEGRPWRDLSVTELENLTETITQITTVERNRRKLLTAQGKQDLQEVAENIAQSILAHNKTKAVKTVENEPKAVEFLKGLHAIHTKVEALCLAVDGGKMGPTWEHIYKPITEAEDVQARRFRDVSAKLKDIFKVYSRKELSSMGVKKEFVEEIRESVTFENRLAVALNMGNAENIERLKVGHNWDDAKIAAVVKTLTERDWKFVQSVWDYLDTFKEESFNLQQEITGMRPKAVEAQPFQVTTSDGVVLEMKGGYYPISYNPKKGERAFGENQKELDKELFGGRNYGQAQTKQGHLKARAGQGQGTPLQLDLSVMTNHAFNVVHDLSYRKAVLDVAKVIKNKTVQDAFTSTVGPQMYRQLRPWLQDIANERQEPMHAVNKWANWARTSTTIMQMGYKATTMFMQPLGITQTIDAIGYRWTAYGIGKVFGNVGKFSEMLQETYARSPFMQNRAKSFDREVRDITKKIKPSMGRFGWIDVIRDKAFVPMGALQMGVDLPTWWGAYAKGLKENGGDEKKAALYADMIVRTCQGSGTTKDLAGVQRGSELQKLFTMFYSYFNTLYNIGARHIRELRADPSPAGILKAANAALLLWFVPVVLGEIVAGRGPEDDEEWWKWSAPLLIQYPFQTIVGVKDIMAGICGEYGYQLSAAQSAPASIVKWYKAMQKAIVEQEGDGLMKPTVEAIGYITSLPLKQSIITVGNLWDWFAGNDPDWYWRDLLFVKPKDRR